MEGTFYTAKEQGGRNELNVYMAAVGLLPQHPFLAPLALSAST